MESKPPTIFRYTMTTPITKQVLSLPKLWVSVHGRPEIAISFESASIPAKCETFRYHDSQTGEDLRGVMVLMVDHQFVASRHAMEHNVYIILTEYGDGTLIYTPPCPPPG